MDNWTIPPFILTWLKKNLEGYQYLTPDSKKLRNEMQANQLKTDDDFRQFGDLYESFLSMVERNPFTRKKEDGTDAEILATDFYFFFFPTKQNVYLPIGLYTEIGVTTPQEGEDLRERLHQAVSEWKKEQTAIAAEEYSDSASLKKDADLNQLIKKTPSPVKYAVNQFLVLALAFLCIAGDFFLFRRRNDEILQSLNSLRSFQISNPDPNILIGVIFICILTISVGYILCSVIWIAHEGKRERFLSAWGRFTKAEEKGENAERGFRSPEELDAIVNRIGTQNYVIEKTFTKENGTDFKNDKIVKEDFLIPKNRRLFQTVRPIHVLAMAAVFLCLLVFAGDLLPEPLLEIRNFVQPKVTEAVMTFSSVFKSEDQKGAAFDSMDIQLTVAKESAKGFSDQGESSYEHKYEQGTRFSILDCSMSEDGILHYKISDSENAVSYVRATRVKLSAENQINASEVQWIDGSGSEKDFNELNALFDGSALTASEIQTGDRICLTFPEEVNLSGMYIVNGKAGDQETESETEPESENETEKEPEDEGARLLILKNQAGETARVLLDKDLNENLAGYVVDLQGFSASALEIEICSTTHSRENCYIAEMIFAE